MQNAITKAIINIKSLAAEAKINRDKCHKTKDRILKNQLSVHRRGPLRFESRLAHLVLAYLKNKPRSFCEPKRKPENERSDLRHRFHRKLERFLGKELTKEEVIEWLKT